MNAPSSPSQNERRACHRVSVNIPAEIHDVDKGIEAGVFEVKITNISRKGLKVKVKGLLNEESGQLLCIVFGGMESYCFAKIVWKEFETEKMSYGLEIIRWPSLSKELAHYIQSQPDDPDLFRSLFTALPLNPALA